MPQCCAVPMCANKTGGHKFPIADKSRLKQWLVAIRRHKFTPSKNSLVCKSHFTADDYQLPKDSVLEKPRPVLKKCAVPSQFPWNKQNSSLHQRIEERHQRLKRKITSQVQESGRFIDNLNVKTQMANYMFPQIVKNTLAPHSRYCAGFSILAEEQQQQEVVGLVGEKECHEHSYSRPVMATAIIPEKAEIKTEPPEPAKQLCSVCNETMSWFVFACVQCVARVCSACDARGHHAAHYVLRVPGGRPESELQAMLNKIREVLLDTNLVETGQPSIVPDIDRDSGETNIEQDPPGEPEYDVIKMEVKTEEEENLAEDQSLLWDPLSDVKETAESASQLTPNHYDVASTPSVTLTAGNPSSEVEKDPLATANISWTDYMDRHLIRSYILIAQTESRKSQIYSRLKKEFVKAFPHIKVTRTQLEEKLRIILSKKLTSDELYKLRNEIHDNFSRQPNAVVASPLNLKGVRLHLAKVTSGEENTKTQQQCQDIEDLISPSLIERYAIVLKYKTEEQKNILEELPSPRVNEGKKLSQQFNRKRKLNNKTKIQQGQNIEDLTSPSLIKQKRNTKYEEKVRLNLLEELHPVRSGRARRVPVRLLT
ncbi:hypothetical protein ABMA27_010732 [Loxostege sticticalis]|uniref:THAP-type domain-containing protein n=2 Tax=Loxostege sticticalis TaxID=481309 RepID=A0ABR3H456_LOXSC